MNSISTIKTGDGVRIAYQQDGKLNAPVLLLSNSLGLTYGMWTPQMQRLESEFRILRYDGRGQGASDSPSGSYSIDRLGRDVIELLDALEIEQVAFCGLSMGGMVGQWLAIQAPHRVSRLVLANTSAFMGPPESWDTRISTVRSGGMEAVVDEVLDRWFTREFRLEHPELFTPVKKMLRAANPEGYIGCCAAIRDMDLRGQNSLIDVPVLVIIGKYDPATPAEHGEALASTIPGAQVRMLRTAHLSNIEQADAFTDAVLEFLLD